MHKTGCINGVVQKGCCDKGGCTKGVMHKRGVVKGDLYKRDVLAGGVGGVAVGMGVVQNLSSQPLRLCSGFRKTITKLNHGQRCL